MSLDLQIEVTGLTKRFPLSREQREEQGTAKRHIVAVDGLSFNVMQGEVFGLLGPNGAGKTTTLRLLSTLIAPDSGEAIIHGHSIIADPKGVRGCIGFLTSELRLEEIFSPSYLFDFFAGLHNVDPGWASERKRLLFVQFGIDRYSHMKLAELSTGMRQMTSLVVAIAHDPAVIIFEEPTNGLDLVAAKTVTDFIFEMREQGKTIVLSTHLFDLVKRVCDRVGIIIGGSMVFQDSLSSLSAGSDLEDLFFKLYDGTRGQR